MHIHAETKGYPCGVELCTKAFKRRRELQAHRKTHGEMPHRENHHDRDRDHDNDNDNDHDMDNEDEEMGDGNSEGDGEGEGEGSSSPAPRDHEPPETTVIDKKSASPPGESSITLSGIFRAGGLSALPRTPLGRASAASKPQSLVSQSPEGPKMDYSSPGMQTTLLSTQTSPILEQFVSQDDDMKSDDDKPG